MIISFTIIGEPKHQHRHRTFRRGNVNINVDPSAENKQDFLWMAMNHRPKTPISGPVSLSIETFHTRPKSHYRTGKYSHLLKDSVIEWKITTPDIDNEIKFIMDALNKVYWKDDAQVSEIITKKKYTMGTPGTIIIIKTL